MRRAVGYVRVSRVGTRSGDSFISPEVQRSAVANKAKQLEVKLVETIEELDASGGDNSRPGWNRALEMIETGKAEAVIVYNLSRFSRSVADGAKAIERIENAGGQLYSCANDVGDDSAMGRYIRTNFLNLAQMQREQATEGFAVAQSRAINLGIWTASKTPDGYVKNAESRKLEIDPVRAPIIRELFERRISGESWSNLAKWYIGQGGSPKTDRQAIKERIKNVAYLGWSRSGEFVNKKAHEPIVSQRVFDLANSVPKGLKPRHDGSLTSQVLLGGIVMCAECGGRMSVSGTRGEATYGCRAAVCTSHPSIKATAVDELAVETLFETLSNRDNIMVTMIEAEDDSEARRALADAEHLLAKFNESKRDYLKAMTPVEFADELSSLKADVDEARIAVEMTGPSRQKIDWSNLGRGNATILSSKATRQQLLEETWNSWTDESRREWLRNMIASLTVTSANRLPIPVAERVTLTLESDP